MRPTNEVLAELLGVEFSLRGDAEVTPVGGGCISDAYRVRCDDGDWFVKSNEVSFLTNFEAESEGLRQLAEVAEHVEGIEVPLPGKVAVVGGSAWLSMRWWERGSRIRFSDFGRALAHFHRASIGEEVGWDRDNFLGASKQPNPSSSDWVEFVAEHRIGFQLRRAVDQGHGDAVLIERCESVISRMSTLLHGRDDSTSLLHGDLWSGNFFASRNGATVMIDPAVYRGCREAEFGMLKLFGGCPNDFYEAYQDEFPMADGCWRRVSVYVLYHLLNHLNLFGSGYLSQCREVAGEILRSR